jgi:hypothetical protein
MEAEPTSDGPPSDGAGFARLVAACAAGTSPLGDVRRLANEQGVRRVILVEGVSDRAALEAVAVRLGRRLDDDGIAVIPMGGAMSVARFLRVLGPEGLGLQLSGLCDAGEERFFRRGLEAAGLGVSSTREGLEALGFGICDADLEDEMIRALGTATVEQVIADEGDAVAFGTFQKQPSQRTQPLDRQLHRFFGTIGGRKERYGRALASRLDPDALPRPVRVALEGGTAASPDAVPREGSHDTGSA